MLRSIRNVKLLKCVSLICLSPLFVFYSSLNYDGPRTKAFKEREEKERKERRRTGKRKEEQGREQNRTEQNRTEQNRTEQNRTEQNRRERNRREEKRREEKRREEKRKQVGMETNVFCREYLRDNKVFFEKLVLAYGRPRRRIIRDFMLLAIALRF